MALHTTWVTVVAAVLLGPPPFNTLVVKGRSMYPTLHHGDVVTYAPFFTPELGDIVYARKPKAQGKTLLKRITGIPGQLVILPNGRPHTLQPREFWLQGDYREDTLDSTSFGIVPRNHILARIDGITCPREHWPRYSVKGVVSVGK